MKLLVDKQALDIASLPAVGRKGKKSQDAYSAASVTFSHVDTLTGTRFFVSLSSDGQTEYRTWADAFSRVGCNCPAGIWGKACKHSRIAASL